MRVALRSLMVLCLACIAGVFWSVGVALAEESSPVDSVSLPDSPLVGLDTSSPLRTQLVTAGSPTEGEQLTAAEEVRRTNPEVVAEREASRTRYEGLSSDETAKLASEKFPAMLDEQAGGLPKLGAGQSLTGFSATNVAQVGLPEGKHELIESLAPMALEASPGHFVPLDLVPKSVGDVFEPTTSLVSVKIPRQLSQGVSIGNMGVSLTPTDTKGVALDGSEGRQDDDTVFFGETGQDTGMIVKPTLGGFEEDTLLFSERSATTLSFRVGLPEGASLVQGEASGAVRVVKEGVTLAVIPCPSAKDSEGAVVPVVMSVAGDMLTLSVDSSSVKLTYPIDVDPEVWDEASPALEEGVPEPPSNFHFIREGSQFTDSETGKGTSWRWTEHVSASHKNGEWGALAYTTQGDSYIRATSIYGSWNEKKVHLENLLEIVPPPKKVGEKPEAESKLVLPEESSPRDGYSVSVEESRRPASENSAEYLTESNGEGSAGENTLESANVRLEQETLPEGHFNTTSSTVDGQPNVLYGTSNWLGPKSGAAELILEDKGIGVSFWSALDNESVSLGEQNLYSEDLCQGGIQCPEKLTEYLTYKSGLPNGESTVRLYGSNAFGSTNSEAESLRIHKMKVDDIPPSGIAISGLGSGNEIGEKEYELKAEATDSLSGIKSIEVAVDGRKIGQSEGACSGSCTGKGEWSINGGEFGVGGNELEVTATDNAGNVSTEKYTLKVHHAPPVPLGPGAVIC